MHVRTRDWSERGRWPRGEWGREISNFVLAPHSPRCCAPRSLQFACLEEVFEIIILYIAAIRSFVSDRSPMCRGSIVLALGVLFGLFPVLRDFTRAATCPYLE